MADWCGVPWESLPGHAGPGDRISPHFVLHELIRSETAARLRIDNSFAGAGELRSAVFLCRSVLEPIREALGPFSPNSVYRCQALERALKGKSSRWRSRSQHTLGQACDLGVPGMTTLDLARWVSDHLEFDQLILECYDPAQGPNSGWVHVSRVPPGLGQNRRESISYVIDPATRQYAYVAGLRPSA